MPQAQFGLGVRTRTTISGESGRKLTKHQPQRNRNSCDRQVNSSRGPRPTVSAKNTSQLPGHMPQFSRVRHNPVRSKYCNLNWDCPCHVRAHSAEQPAAPRWAQSALSPALVLCARSTGIFMYVLFPCASTSITVDATAVRWTKKADVKSTLSDVCNFTRN